MVLCEPSWLNIHGVIRHYSCVYNVIIVIVAIIVIANIVTVLYDCCVRRGNLLGVNQQVLLVIDGNVHAMCRPIRYQRFSLWNGVCHLKNAKAVTSSQITFILFSTNIATPLPFLSLSLFFPSIVLSKQARRRQ